MDDLVSLYYFSIHLKGSFWVYSSQFTCPNISSICISDNRPFFKINISLLASLWLELNLVDSTQISIISLLYTPCVRLLLKITADNFFVVFSSPFFSIGVSQIHWFALCIPEIREANIRRMLSGSLWGLSREPLPIMKLRSVIWDPGWIKSESIIFIQVL